MVRYTLHRGAEPKADSSRASNGVVWLCARCLRRRCKRALVQSDSERRRLLAAVVPIENPKQFLTSGFSDHLGEAKQGGQLCVDFGLLECEQSDISDGSQGTVRSSRVECAAIYRMEEDNDGEGSILRPSLEFYILYR